MMAPRALGAIGERREVGPSAPWVKRMTLSSAFRRGNFELSDLKTAIKPSRHCSSSQAL
jgi:hypothetical protein